VEIAESLCPNSDQNKGFERQANLQASLAPCEKLHMEPQQWSETVDSVGCTGPKIFFKKNKKLHKKMQIASNSIKTLIYVAAPRK